MEPDVVIVGGGIAGSSLAYALADAGVAVTVLEAATAYEDRVRGEQMHAWGVAEARELGVEQVLLDAGAHVSGLWRQFVAGTEVADVPMSRMVPGVEGTLNLRHPDACLALSTAAEAAGATVVRGVADVAVEPGGSSSVSYSHGDRVHEIRPGLVVGADGRNSSVRRQIGVTLERQEPVNHIAGLLLDGLDVPDDFDVLASDGDIFFVLFHQGRGRARAYVVVGKSGRHRFAGPEAVGRFLAAVDFPCYPWSEAVRAGTPAGPCATYPGDDTWTTEPYVDGVLLIGDAAGWNDPIIGEGLSISMRDARTARDLVLGGLRTAEDFRPYGEERMERMRRLRLMADVISAAFGEDAANRQARREWFAGRMAAMDPELFPLMVASFSGPENVPAELVDERIVERVRSA